MSAAVEFEPGVPDVRAPAPVIEWILAAEPRPEPAPDALAGTGALRDGVLDPSLEAALRAVREARIDLLLERGRRRGRGWLGPAGAVIGHPLPDGRERLAMVPGPLLVDALVLLNDVGPRPRRTPVPRIAAPPGELAQALAARDPSHIALADREQATAFAALVAGLREHWRVATRWEPADGSLGRRELEVLDSDGGYWLVVPDDPAVELWPVTATAVFRALCLLFPPPSEVRGWTER